MTVKDHPSLGPSVVTDQLARFRKRPGSTATDGWLRTEQKPSFWVFAVARSKLKSKDIHDLNLDPLLVRGPCGAHEELGSSDLVEAVRGKGVVGHLNSLSLRRKLGTR
jgi:hypothetical protein